jgi:hypothetical protein
MLDIVAVSVTTADTRDHQHKINGNFSITRAIIPDNCVIFQHIRDLFIFFSNTLGRASGIGEIENFITRLCELQESLF